MNAHGHIDDARFCSRCGTRLVPPPPPETHEDPPPCSNCGLVPWRDPKLAAGVLVGREGRVLLVKRNHEPGLGLWSFPSGYVDRGEIVEHAAAREAFEEAGVAVTITRLLGAYSREGHPVVLIVYEATAAGEPVAGPEASDVGFFALDELPTLAFEHDRDIIEAWARGA